MLEAFKGISTGKLVFAKAEGNNLDLVIDHNEKQCKDIFRGQCYYTIVVMGQAPKDTDYT